MSFFKICSFSFLQSHIWRCYVSSQAVTPPNASQVPVIQSSLPTASAIAAAAVTAKITALEAVNKVGFDYLQTFNLIFICSTNNNTLWIACINFFAFHQISILTKKSRRNYKVSSIGIFLQSSSRCGTGDIDCQWRNKNCHIQWVLNLFLRSCGSS